MNSVLRRKAKARAVQELPVFCTRENLKYINIEYNVTANTNSYNYRKIIVYYKDGYTINRTHGLFYHNTN